MIALSTAAVRHDIIGNVRAQGRESELSGTFWLENVVPDGPDLQHLQIMPHGQLGDSCSLSRQWQIFSFFASAH